MHFSGKITNSILNFLERQGVGLERLFEGMEIPSEFLRDPSSWIDAHDVESFLRTVEDQFVSVPRESGQLVTKIGHSSIDLKAWGVLDSVLRMVEKPQDIFLQPQRFISYFISPAPPIGGLNKSDTGVDFDLPISSNEFPFVCEYLRSALESLPQYQGQPLASVEWRQTHLSIRWGGEQSSLFAEGTLRSQLKPEFINTIVQTLEQAQTQIEEQKKELTLKEAELKVLQSTLVKGSDFSIPPHLAETVVDIRAQISRLADYMARTNQLVTLLVGQGRMDRQVQEAMRRMDYERIQEQFPTLIEKVMQDLENLNSLPQDLPTASLSVSQGEEETVDLNAMVEGLVESLGSEVSKRMRVEKMLFLDRQVCIRPKLMAPALKQVLKDAIRAVAPRGRVRIVTRPVNGRAEIEISELAHPEHPIHTAEVNHDREQPIENLARVVREHQGKFDHHIRSQDGYTFLIQLPT